MAHPSEVRPIAEGVVIIGVEIHRDPNGLRTITTFMGRRARAADAASAASARSGRHVICNSGCVPATDDVPTLS